jgi:putative FmdB family regulatory protein
MATYEYRCTSCEFLFEDNLPMARRKEPCESACPKCGKETVTQDIRTAPGAAIDSTLKNHSGFKEMIGKIHKNNAGSNIPIDKYL